MFHGVEYGCVGGLGDTLEIEEDIYEEYRDEETEEAADIEREVEDEIEDNEDNAHNQPQVAPAPAKPKKKVKNPQLKLDPERLKGPRGISSLENVFKNFPFLGKGHEKRNLDRVMKQLEHWAHRLFPKFKFDDFLEKAETLGQKKTVMVYVQKLRMGLETAEASNDSNEKLEDDQEEEMSVDPFDDLISHQLPQEIVLPTVSHVTSSSSPSVMDSVMTSVEKERMERNRILAREKMLARLKGQNNIIVPDEHSTGTDRNLENNSAVLPEDRGGDSTVIEDVK